jgi:hypothetical protein
MFVGHYAIGLLGKRVEPKISLGTLVFASMLPDLLWCVFMIAGIEGVRIKPGVTITPAMTALDALEHFEFAYSHSLLTGAVWGALLAVFYFSCRGDKRAAWILFAAVMSHWVLDFASHPPDMAIAPGLPWHFGLGLWKSIPATLVVEGAFWLFAIISYLQVTQPRHRAWLFVFWIPVAFLTLAWYGNITQPGEYLKMSKSKRDSVGRRKFLKNAAAGAAALVSKPKSGKAQELWGAGCRRRFRLYRPLGGLS